MKELVYTPSTDYDEQKESPTLRIPGSTRITQPTEQRPYVEAPVYDLVRDKPVRTQSESELELYLEQNEPKAIKKTELAGNIQSLFAPEKEEVSMDELLVAMYPDLYQFHDQETAQMLEDDKERHFQHEMRMERAQRKRLTGMRQTESKDDDTESSVSSVQEIKDDDTVSSVSSVQEIKDDDTESSKTDITDPYEQKSYSFI